MYQTSSARIFFQTNNKAVCEGMWALTHKYLKTVDYYRVEVYRNLGSEIRVSSVCVYNVCVCVSNCTVFVCVCVCVYMLCLWGVVYIVNELFMIATSSQGRAR